jgi:hypothetical protein
MPVIGGSMCAAHFGVRDPGKLILWGLASSGIAAITAFWAFFLNHQIGLVFTFFLVFGFGTAALVLGVRLRSQIDWRSLVTPLALWWLCSIFVTSLGFLYGGTANPLILATTRFSHALPNDNSLPLYFGEVLFHTGHKIVPPSNGVWLSSDRPPLQMGYYFLTRPFGTTENFLPYQLMGIAIQQLWVIGAWALLRAARIRRSTTALILVALMVSDLVIVQGFYVWPKLVPVGFLLGAGSVLLTSSWNESRERISSGLLVGIFFGLAILCHGTSLFAIIPMLVIAALKARPNWKFLVAALVSISCLYMPWTRYQRSFNPPGDRLNYTMLAGDNADASKPLIGEIVTSYSTAGISGALGNKIVNFNSVTGGFAGTRVLLSALKSGITGDFQTSIKEARGIRFFSLLQLEGIFLTGPLIAMVLAIRKWRLRSPEDLVLAKTCALFAVLAVAFWIGTQFGDAGSVTLVHVGSFAVPALITIGCLTSVSAYSQRIAAAIAGVNIAASLFLYIPFMDSGVTQVSKTMTIAVIISLAGFIAVASLLSSDPSSEQPSVEFKPTIQPAADRFQRTTP